MADLTDIEWIATGDPNVIAASGYPVQIERKGRWFHAYPVSTHKDGKDHSNES